MGFKKRPETTKPRPTRTARTRARKDAEPAGERDHDDEQLASDDAEDLDEDPEDLEDSEDDKDPSLDEDDSDDGDAVLGDSDLDSDGGEPVAAGRRDEEDEFVEEDFGDDDFVDIPEDGDFGDEVIPGVDDEEALVRRPIRGRRATTFNDVAPDPEEVDLLSYEEEEESKEDDAEEEESPLAYRDKEEPFVAVEEDDSAAEEEEEEDEPETSTRTDSAQSVSEFLAALPPAQRRLIVKLRDLIQETLPNAEESFRIGMLHYSLGGNVAYLDAKRDHVNLGFFRGSELTRIEQARRLLQGTGANLRYIKVFDEDDIRRDLFVKLLREAHTLNKG